MNDESEQLISAVTSASKHSLFFSVTSVFPTLQKLETKNELNFIINSLTTQKKPNSNKLVKRAILKIVINTKLHVNSKKYFIVVFLNEFIPVLIHVPNLINNSPSSLF